MIFTSALINAEAEVSDRALLAEVASGAGGAKDAMGVDAGAGDFTFLIGAACFVDEEAGNGVSGTRSGSTN